jgi:hypothetical protein
MALNAMGSAAEIPLRYHVFPNAMELGRRACVSLDSLPLSGKNLVEQPLTTRLGIVVAIDEYVAEVSFVGRCTPSQYADRSVNLRLPKRAPSWPH